VGIPDFEPGRLVKMETCPFKIITRQIEENLSALDRLEVHNNDSTGSRCKHILIENLVYILPTSYNGHAFCKPISLLLYR
jgi:hypothetical protein